MMLHIRLTILALVALLAGAAPAVACTGADRMWIPVEYANGAIEPPPEFALRVLERVSGSSTIGSGSGPVPITSFLLFATGDLAQGEQYDSADGQARAASLALAEARAAAIRRLVGNSLSAISGKEEVRETRVDWNEYDRAFNGLNDRVRGGVLLLLARPDRPEGVPVPVC